MAEANLIVAILLFLVGTGLLLWFLSALLSPLFGGSFSKKLLSPVTFISKLPTIMSDTKAFIERWRFRKAIKNLNELAQKISEKKTNEAQVLFSQALYLELIAYNPHLIAATADHHNQLLNLLISFAEIENRTIRNLPILEEMFTKRAMLQRSIYEVNIAKHRFLEKHKGKGKPIPNWSTAEFDNKLKDLISQFKETALLAKEELNKALKGSSGTAENSQQSNLH